MSRGPLASTASPAGPAPGLVRELLAGAIDYAGLFPPAALDMETALRNFASYRTGADAPLLGRFVVPAARLSELAEAMRAVGASGIAVSAVLGTNVPADLDAVTDFNARANGAASVDSIEAKAERPAAIYELASKASGVEVFVELPLDGELELLVEAVRAVGVRAKIRTGGVTAGAFPAARSVVRFIRACLAAGVPFKATAGLHHPVTGTYPLTYATDAPLGTMFGFLNVFLATAFLRVGISDDEAARLLEERDASSFSFDERGADWHGRHIDFAQLAATHARTFGSWGSCSFREPVDELRSLALLS
jgi:hypothetical protein